LTVRAYPPPLIVTVVVPDCDVSVAVTVDGLVDVAFAGMVMVEVAFTLRVNGTVALYAVGFPDASTVSR
jgi:hypothetical protein